MSGIKKFSELSLEELIKRMSHACCYKCETFVEDNKHWSCQGCECVCCDSCVEEGDVDNEELEEDCGFICKECRPNYKKKDQTCEECEAHNTDGNWQCFTLSNGDEKVYCDQCVDDGHWECCHECNVLMGDKIFDDRDEFEEYPDRDGGYDDENGWLCNNHRQEEESAEE